MVTHHFKKKPNSRNLSNRTVSFSSIGEVDHVAPADEVILDVQFKSGYTRVTISGREFIDGLFNRTTKDGTEIKVFRF